MIYDISTQDKEGRRRLNKTMKICRKYLTHVQKSVFEGDITEGQLTKLRNEVDNIVHQEEDFVIVYSLPDGVSLKRDILTNTADPTDNFI